MDLGAQLPSQRSATPSGFTSAVLRRRVRLFPDWGGRLPTWLDGGWFPDPPISAALRDRLVEWARTWNDFGPNPTVWRVRGLRDRWLEDGYRLTQQLRDELEPHGYDVVADFIDVAGAEPPRPSA